MFLTMFLTIGSVIVIIFLRLVYYKFIYYKYTCVFDFWKKRNVKGPEPKPFFGNYKKMISGKEHASEVMKSIYDEYKDEKMVGIYALNSPVLILRDPDLIKDVLISDFSAFADRGIEVFDTVEPHSQHLFNLPYNAWRPLRSHLSVPFTGSKSKDVFDAAQDVAHEFVRFIERAALKEDRLSCFALYGKYTAEVIGKCGFGLKMNQLGDEESEFQKVGAKRQLSNFYNFIRRFLREYVPGIYKYCGFFMRNEHMTHYYVNMLREIKKYRRDYNIRVKDFVGRLLELKDNPDKVPVEITDNLLAAQAYVLFTAGADSSSAIICYGLYELAMNEIIQEKLRNEIYISLDDHKKLSYANLKNMKYIDKVYKEILRKYPLRNIMRTSNATYTFRGTDVNVTIPANTKIIIPHYAIHRDANYYPNPDSFDPERFDSDNQEYRHPMTYLPFGDGPRYCIGKIWAENIIKVIIVNVILNFDVKIDKADKERKENDPRKVFLWPKGGINLKFVKRRV